MGGNLIEVWAVVFKGWNMCHELRNIINLIIILRYEQYHNYLEKCKF